MTPPAFRERLKLLPLKGRYKSYRSINVTGDWRAIFRELNFSLQVH